MDYGRIYGEFIRHRRANPPDAGEYVERHHILPRALGGDDKPENLIRLRPEDHFFAHLLLARIHGGSMWVALVAMANLPTKGPGVRRATLKGRTKFGHIKRSLVAHYREALSGPSSKLADGQDYELRSFSGDVLRGNRFELSERTGLPRTSIAKLVTGTVKTYSGWYSPIHNPNGDDKHHWMSVGRSCSEEHTLYHHDGRVFSGTKSEFRRENGVSLYFQNEGGHCQGWYRSPTEAAGHAAAAVNRTRHAAAARGDISGSRNPRADKQKHAFRHTLTGERVVASRVEMRALHGIPSGELSTLIGGRRASVGGWVLDKPNAPLRVPVPRQVWMFVSRTGETKAATQRDFAVQIGADWSYVARVVRGERDSVKGWRFLGPAP